MKIKYNTLTVIVLGVATLFTACSDEFFNTSPATQITTAEVYTSEANADAVVNATIKYLLEQSTSQDNPGLPTIFLTHDVMGEDAFAREGRYGYRDSYPYKDPFDNTTRRCLFFWTLQYTTIDYANNIIANADETKGEKWAYIKGQGYALRALNYLNLVRQYQFTYAKAGIPNEKAVPIYIKPTTPTTDPNPRATVQEVYDQILSDLTQAESLLVGFERRVKNRPDLNVVQGLFARTYLTLENWTKAAEYAAKARVGYPLMEAEDYEGFNDVSNSEWIWGHPQTATQNKGGASYLAYIETTPYDIASNGAPIYYGYNSIIPDPHFVEKFEDGDIRKSLFEIEKRNADSGNLYRLYRYKKFHNKYPNHDGHIVLMRSSEMLLIEAESKARLNDVPAAITLLNELRAKRNLTALAANDFTKDTAIEEILLERRKELWGEGFRLYDILRTQTAPVRLATTETFIDDAGDEVTVKGHWILKFPDGSDLVPNSKYYLFPIPLNEINNNPNLDN